MNFTEMHGGDPFRQIAELCHVSSPQEEYLRRCPFAFQSDDEFPLFADDSGETPVASTGIMMLSPPENIEQQNGDNAPRDATAEVFHPRGSFEEQLLQPELLESVEGAGYGEKIEAVDGDRMDDSVAVDLGKDTDLGFCLETELTEKIEIDSGMISSTGVCRAHESKVLHCESTEVRVSKREPTLNEGVCESHVKKSKISDKNLEIESPGSGLGTCRGKTLETIVKTMLKLKSPLNESKVLDKKLESEAPRGSLAAESEKTLSALVKIISKSSPSAEKSKDLDNNVDMETLRNGFDAGKEKSGENLEESVDKTLTKAIDLPTHSSKLPQGYQSEETVVKMHASSTECHGESSTKRKWEFSAGLLESRIQQIKESLRNKKNREEGISNSKKDCKADQVCNNREKNAFRKSIDDIDKFRYVGPKDTLLSKREKDAEGKRALPASLLGKASLRRGGVECDCTRSPKDYKEFSLLDVLKMLSKDRHHDPSLEKLSLLEVAKRCGMTFP
uniref:Uncharacterized protein n=1 Tax=Rhizophora mucronata TaxID=61149 RepID=A0A2P2J626_RHIMU